MAPNTNIKDIMTKTQTTDFFIACKESRIENNTSFYSSFYLGPFDESLSQTLANDLRRTLLSELTGLAITSVEIEGVLHKFSSLPGMKESVLDLICNLQSIVLKKQNLCLESSLLSVKRPTKKTYTGFLSITGPGVIKAMDLKLPAGLQCVDPNQYIATLAEDGMVNLKFNINEGKNFIKQKQHNLDVKTLKKRNILLQNFKNKMQDARHLAINLPTNPSYNTENKNKKLSISNPIPLDAVFMPVTKVNCIIEENNIYSDFSTDYANFLTQTSNSTSNQITNKTLNSLNSFFNFFYYNSIYQTSNLLKNSNKNVFGGVQHKNILDNKFKLIPWHSNGLFFSMQDGITQNHQDMSNLHYAPKISSLMPVNNVSKIKTFLASNPSVLALQGPSLSVTLKRTPKTSLPGSLFTALKAKDDTVRDKLKVFLDRHDVTSYGDIKSVLKEHYKGFKINNVSGLNQQIINLEYAKILKLKPLQKKSNLILEIWTNGSIHPRQALYLCFAFLSNSFLKLQTVKMIGSMFKSEVSYGNIKYSYFSNYNLRLLKNTMAKGHGMINDGFRLKWPLAIDGKMASILHNGRVPTILWPKAIDAKHRSSLTMNPSNVPFKNTKIKQNIYTKVLIKTLDNDKLQSQKTTKRNGFNPMLLTFVKAPVGILKISLRSYTALKKAGIFTLKDLLNKSKTDLLEIKNLGINSISEIETQLAFLGYTLKNL